MAEVLPIATPSLGDRSYLVHDGEVAAVIDPQRDTDRIRELAAARGLRITHVAETHIHNDYLTGGLALARSAGASYLVSAGDPVRFDRTPVRDGDSIRISGRLALRVLATPGHTFTHLSYALADAGRLTGVFTGGSLLYGSTGRTDLLGPQHAAELARAQHASARRLASELPGEAMLYPTHGFGSFCAASQAGGQSSTVGAERRVNPVLRLDEQAYVETLLAGLDAWPAYYAHMGPANLAGPDEPDLSPPRRASADQLRRRIESGEWVVDLRDRVAFAAGFLPGSLSFPLDSSFASYLGWTIPWGNPVTLLGETPEQVAQAQRELVRIGVERPAAAATGQPADWSGGQPLSTLRLAKFGDLAAARRRPPGNGTDPPVVLDVRQRLEWESGHLAGAVHIPLDRLAGRIAGIPPGDLWVHCHSGYRATIAASLLAAGGRPATCVNDEFGNAEAAGLPVVPG
jgi:glyoxylase-like metal-dependent hydrolase (beta-lactamase superfamily II)/rhodanese-related sulfurtransferase